MVALFTNNAATTLASAVAPSDTSITVASASAFPTPTGGNYFLATLVGITGTPIEIVQVTSVTGNVFTVVRAQEGTTASSFNVNDLVQLRITAGEMNYIYANLGSGGGASAGGAVYENTQSITANYTMSTNKNGESVGPITIAAGVTVTIPAGSRYVIL